jgi:non-specific serine/threonine protein kinase
MHPDTIRTLTPTLTPSGHLRVFTDDASVSSLAPQEVGIIKAFSQSSAHGLLYLGTSLTTAALPQTWSWWRDFATRFLTELRITAGNETPLPPVSLALETLIICAPPMRGAEYLTPDTLSILWQGLGAALLDECATHGESIETYLKARNEAWNLVGRVHFFLAENRKDPDAPFAFIATYTTNLTAHGKAQHLPLSQALAEFSGGRKKAQLLSLLMPVQRAAKTCDWLAEMVHSKEIYHPLRWQVSDVVRFLQDLPAIEAAGIVVRMPALWASGRPSRPKVRAALGSKPPSNLGLDALLDFDMNVSVDGEPLTADEIRDMLAQQDGLQWIRGRWVEIDQKRLSRVLEQFDALAQTAQHGLPMAQAMRLLAGSSLDDDAPDANWSDVTAGAWLAETLQHLRSPLGLAAVDPGPGLQATLRPYQQQGLRWLYLLSKLGLGACLADDMGLGKTIQVLALLLVLKQENKNAPRPSLLVAPASLLANWQQEAQRFTPGLRCIIAHPSEMSSTELLKLDASQLDQVDLVVTTFGTLPRLSKLHAIHWHVAVIDEAQAIKNPSTKQTKQIKKIKASIRIALTGTPVENRLSDLWSIFDFTHPGLLGSERAFASFSKRLAESRNYGPFRALIAPYILRRLKTDKRIISDLPDKTELATWCVLSPNQAAQYQEAVQTLAKLLESSEGIQRKGLVLSFLMRFKQICNHPSHWLGDGAWQPEDSGKFTRLREIAETISAKQEKMLLFTQFQETTAPLAAFLGKIFGRPGLILHGGTPVGKRREFVKQFQEDESIPFFVLSLKAGGSGLNLTAASHVVHFDRWWNPAVENQATDRAFRIGQHRNVLVHKFICRGTIEQRIDELIQSKQALVSDVIEGSREINLTEMSDKELLNLVKLDLHSMEH